MNIASGGMSWIDILYMLNNKLTTPPHRSVSVCVCQKNQSSDDDDEKRLYIIINFRF